MSDWLSTFFLDVRYSLRQFMRSPMFTAIAILSLGLGIGANTAIFSIMNSMLLSSLPVREPERLVILTSPNEEGRSTGVGENERTWISYPEFVQLREQLTTVSGLCAAGSSLQQWQVRIGDQGQQTVSGKLVSEDYFAVLGVEPALGRLFNAHDAQGPGQDPYVVISHGFWQRHFNGRSDVIGTTITLNGTTFNVIGVSEPRFQGESVARNPDLWLPMMMQPSIYPGRDWLQEDPAKSPDKVMWLNAFGRLKPGATLENVQAEVKVVFPRMMQAYYSSTLTPELQKRVMSQYLVVRDAHAGTFPGRDDITLQLQILLAVAGVVLLIACANVANLLLARATGRHREMSVRFALGASRARIYRQLVTETLILGLFGGLIGLLVGFGGSRILISLLSDPDQPFNVAYAPDWRVFGFTAGVALITGLLFGVAPARRAMKIDITSSLREGGRSVTQSGGRLNLARSLVVGQVALSFLLTVGAGLLVRTLWNLQSISLGFPKERMLQVDVDGVSAGYKDRALTNFYAGLSERLSVLPGVQGVAYSRLGLLTGGVARSRIKVDGVIPELEKNRRAHYDFVSPGYFALLGAPLLMGRDIGPQDTSDSQKVCVINEVLANRLFGEQNPLGRQLTVFNMKGSNPMSIVGVVKNIRASSLRDEIPPTFYAAVRQPFMEETAGPMVFQIRTTVDPNSTLKTVRETILTANPDAPIIFTATTDEVIADQTVTESQIARLCSIFCILALLLAAVGLYGVVSDNIARRTNEIGTRMAVGASPRRIIGMILGETAMVTGVGLAVGLLAAGLSTRVIAAYLFGLGRMDYITIAFALGLVSLVALAAGYLPATRAGRVNPVTALRQQ